MTPHGLVIAAGASPRNRDRGQVPLAGQGHQGFTHTTEPAKREGGRVHCALESSKDGILLVGSPASKRLVGLPYRPLRHRYIRGNTDVGSCDRARRPRAWLVHRLEPGLSTPSGARRSGATPSTVPKSPVPSRWSPQVPIGTSKAQRAGGFRRTPTATAKKISACCRGSRLQVKPCRGTWAVAHVNATRFRARHGRVRA